MQNFTYAGNSPLSYTDPSGLMNCWDCGPIGGGGGGVGCSGSYADYGCSDCDPLLYDCYGVGGGWEGTISSPHPKFRGYKDLDPNRTMNEHLGLPAGMRLPSGDLLDIFGMGSGTCEFGACGGIADPFAEDEEGLPQALEVIAWCNQHPHLCTVSKYLLRKAFDQLQGKAAPGQDVGFDWLEQFGDCNHKLGENLGTTVEKATTIPRPANLDYLMPAREYRGCIDDVRNSFVSHAQWMFLEGLMKVWRLN
jgi:hypothetical protein